MLRLFMFLILKNQGIMLALIANKMGMHKIISVWYEIWSWQMSICWLSAKAVQSLDIIYPREEFQCY